MTRAPRLPVPQLFAQTLIPRTIGFDEIFKSLDALASRASETVDPFPPYDIIKVSESEWQVRLAVAGFAKENLSVELENDVLSISGTSQTESVDELANHEYLYKGISSRKFMKRWTVSSGSKVETAALDNGILTVKIVKPAIDKPVVKIDIV